MRPDPLSALRHLEALDNQQLSALADRVDKVRRTRKGTARRVRDITDDGRQVLWHCTPPYMSWDDGPYEYVATLQNLPDAALIVGFENYAFPADENGKITDWGELDLSQKGRVSHEQLWRDAGWWTE